MKPRSKPFARVACVAALVVSASACGQAVGSASDASAAQQRCQDADHDGFGVGCARGPDCDDANPTLTNQCRACSQHSQQGCPCEPGAAERCFLPDTRSADAQVICSEGTRVCRDGTWSGCENTYSYIAPTQPDTQQLVNAGTGNPTCSICDIRCFKVIDNLTADAGSADSGLTLADGGGLTLALSASAPDGGVLDAAVGGCTGLAACCSGLSGALGSACSAVAGAGDEAACDDALATYCPSTAITGPRTDCVTGSGQDTDCDGIPNVVDEAAGSPLVSTNNRTVFHQLDVGERALDTIDVGYRLRDADVYVLFDATGTMAAVRQNLEDLLTTGNVVHCAQLSECCGADSTCNAVAESNDASQCYDAQPTYCGAHVDCADVDNDGAPNNELAAQGVVGGIRCLVGGAWFGLGEFRELPVHREPEQDPCLAEGCRYGDRDEQLFRHLVDMTPDHVRVQNALSAVSMNYNWDEPEGGWVALHSVVTGEGHYFGMNRPAVADRSAGEGCGPNTFGYPCFRDDAIPIVVLFTDAAHHNGPGSGSTDPTYCNGRGSGCPYKDLTSLNSWTSSSKDGASDLIAHYVTPDAERATSAYDVGDVRGRYLTLVGDTSSMQADYPGSATGCSADDAAPDVLFRFEVGSGGATNINFHLTKNDAYSGTLYGRWVPWSLDPGSDDPTPATEFGAVVSVFRGSPDDLAGSSKLLKCVADPQPSPLRGSNWASRAVDFSQNLSAGTYYLSIKGTTATSAGHYQLQVGETSARVTTTYAPPTWSQTRAALVASGVRVLPVVATGGFSNNFVTTAEAQAKLVALASGAVRADGTPIWYKIQNDGAETGKAIVHSIAELADHLAMDVSLVAVDGPDPGASLFTISVTPQNSPGCLQPHPLVDSEGLCTAQSALYDCNTQYDCHPGAAPKYLVTFENPTAAPVPPNPDDPYGGYHFELQLKGDSKYLLAQIPVYLIPTTRNLPPPPAGYETTGVYEQEIVAADCATYGSGDAGVTLGESNLLPSWGDVYFDADMPEGTRIDFQLCTADTEAGLDSCVWDDTLSGGRPRISASVHGSCGSDADCLDVAGYGSGVCNAQGNCQFMDPPKIWTDINCTMDSQCPNGPLGSGDYFILSRCETQAGARGFGHCVGLSEPLDLGASLQPGEDGRPYAKVHITLHADAPQDRAPTLFSWYLTYTCHAAL